MAAHMNRFIDDAGLSETTSLTHLLDKYARDDNIEEVNLIKHSPFYTRQNLHNS